MVIRSWSLPLGSWLGVNLRLHFSFLFLLVFVWLTQTQSGSDDPKLTFLRSLGFVGIVLGSVLVHELGHLLLAYRSGALPRVVMLLPIGGLPVWEVEADQESQPTRRALPMRESWIALAGPVTSLLLACLVALLVTQFAPQDRLLQPPWLHINNLPRTAFWVNLLLAGLNLLPAYPLDGGRVLRAVFAMRTDPASATRQAVNVGNVFVLLLMFGGLWNPWFMLAGFFVFLATQQEERTVLFQSVLETVHMEEIMLTEFATLSPADTLEDALHKAVHTLQDDFPVVRGTDMVGVVSRQKILEALRGEGNAYVQSVMNRAYEIAARSDSLASALRKLTLRGLTLIPVVDQERLVGIVTLQNLMHSMSVLAESRKLRRKQQEDDDDL